MKGFRVPESGLGLFSRGLRLPIRGLGFFCRGLGPKPLQNKPKPPYTKPRVWEFAVPFKGFRVLSTFLANPKDMA